MNVEVARLNFFGLDYPAQFVHLRLAHTVVQGALEPDLAEILPGLRVSLEQLLLGDFEACAEDVDLLEPLFHEPLVEIVLSPKNVHLHHEAVLALTAAVRILIVVDAAEPRFVVAEGLRSSDMLAAQVEIVERHPLPFEHFLQLLQFAIHAS